MAQEVEMRERIKERTERVKKGVVALVLFFGGVIILAIFEGEVGLVLFIALILAFLGLVYSLNEWFVRINRL